MKESVQDQKIINWIKDRYGKAARTEKRHADMFTEEGLPDLNIVVYGMSIQIEDKIHPAFPRDNQIKKLLEYDISGAISFWCDTFQMFLYKWEEFVEGDPRFKFMKAEWEKRAPIENIARAFLSYKDYQEKDKAAWDEKYKRGDY